jgi:hypothetical protein
MFCFHASSAAGEIVGAPWAFSVEGPATLSDGLWRNCTFVQYTATGRVTIVGGVPGKSAQIALDVAPDGARVAPPVTQRLLGLGERAMLFQ